MLRVARATTAAPAAAPTTIAAASLGAGARAQCGLPRGWRGAYTAPPRTGARDAGGGGGLPIHPFPPCRRGAGGAPLAHAHHLVPSPAAGVVRGRPGGPRAGTLCRRRRRSLARPCRHGLASPPSPHRWALPPGPTARAARPHCQVLTPWQAHSHCRALPPRQARRLARVARRCRPHCWVPQQVPHCRVLTPRQARRRARHARGCRPHCWVLSPQQARHRATVARGCRPHCWLPPQQARRRATCTRGRRPHCWILSPQQVPHCRVLTPRQARRCA